MSDLIVTFTRAIVDPPRAAIVPLEVARQARSEVVPIGTGGDTTTAAAAAGENVISLLAEADCWIDIGEDPEAAVGTSRKMLEGERLQFWAQLGDKVSVIAVE